MSVIIDATFGILGPNTAEGGLGPSTTVTNLDALKALRARPEAVIVQGYASSNDGGGGLFTWVADDSTTPNNGTVVQCSGGPSGRYKRLYDNVINAKWFGATGNGSDNDTTAIQNAINAMPTYGGKLYFPQGNYRSGPLTLSGKFNITIIGNGRESSRLVLISTGTLLTISGTNFATISDLGFDLEGGPTGIAGTTGMIINNASGNTTVHRCDFFGFADDGLFLEGSVGTQMSGHKVLECYFLGNGRHQLHCLYSNDMWIETNQFGRLIVDEHAQTGCYSSCDRLDR